MLVRDILVAKGDEVCTIQSSQSLQEALRFLISRNIGALVVLDGPDQAVGILTERDILRECHKQPAGWFKLRISNVMNRVIRAVRPETDLEIVMEMMTENRIRHICVMEDQRLVGIVSIGDVVKARLRHTEHENQHMRNYINGI